MNTNLLIKLYKKNMTILLYFLKIYVKTKNEKLGKITQKKEVYGKCFDCCLWCLCIYKNID